MKRFFNVAIAALAMIAVALLSAYLSMRIAIHGREVKVPSLAGLPISEAAKRANALGLGLNIENRFYSHAPSGSVLSQSPAPGSLVRREWTIRITESLGPQQVSIPSLVGQSERPATIAIRRLDLELGTLARLPGRGPAGIVLAQTPTPSTSGADSAHISLLLSAPPSEAPDSREVSRSTFVSQSAAPTAYVMPYLIGLTLYAAAGRVAAAGLHIVSAEDLNSPPAAASSPSPSTDSPASPTSNTGSQTPRSASPEALATPITSPGVVVAQSPPAGRRVLSGDPVRISLAH